MSRFIASAARSGRVGDGERGSGPDLSAEAAQVLTELRRPVLRRRLAELSRAHLIDGAPTCRGAGGRTI